MGHEAAGAVNDVVHIDFRKYPDEPHWQYEMRRLTADEFGMWLWAPAGTITRRGNEPATTSASLFVTLIGDDAWYSAIWNAAGKYEVYVDINTPARWNGDSVRMVDLDLDVVRYREDGRVAVLDEDEFADHQRSLGYPAQYVDGARSAAAGVFVALSSGSEPFGDVGRARIDQALAIAT